MEILIIDDDTHFIDTLKNDLMKHFIHSNDRTYFYTFSNNFNQIDDSQYYDLIFIDIDLVTADGIELAQTLKKKNMTQTIIFISAKNNLIHHSLIVHPFFFIRKNHYADDLALFFKLLDQEHLSHLIIPLSYGTCRSCISLKNIIYIEYSQRILLVHSTNHVYQDNRSLKSMLNEVKDYDFVQVHKSFIVNLKCIASFTGKIIYLLDGTEIPIGKKFFPLFKEQFNQFLIK